MADIHMIRAASGLVPADPDAAEWLTKVKAGSVVKIKATKMRNWDFHKKFFAMLNVAYDNWDKPVIQTKWGEAHCPFSRFREFITVKAGYFDPVVLPTGEIRPEAKSISFANMEQEEFDKLYSSAINAVLKHILTDWNNENMDEAVQNFIVGFG